jgi:hypothetical protein
VRRVQESDAEELSNLYKEIFPEYPTPEIWEPSFFKKSDSPYVFFVVLDKTSNKIVSGASAYVVNDRKNAELTGKYGIF